MKRAILILLSLTFTFSLAQPQGGANPEMRAMMEPYLNLMSSVGLVLELEKSSDLPITSEQASSLMPILTELTSSSGYTAERATELLDLIELGTLTPEQLVWIDGEFLKRQEAGENGEGRGGLFGRGGGQGGQVGQGQNGQRQNGQGQRPGGPGGQPGFFQRITAGEPVNLFIENENAAALLKELIDLVSAKIP